MLVFGSTALAYWVGGEVLGRLPSDLDLIAKTDLKSEPGTVEFHWDDAFQEVINRNKHKLYVDLNFLYTIKISHCPWEGKNGKWVQHLKDIDLMRQHGATLDENLRGRLYKVWEKKFGKKQVDFSRSNSEFFTEKVERKYDHDWLHEQLAYYDKPLHESIRESPESPMCSESLFNQLSEKDKLLTVFEELYVIAAERFVFVENPLPTRIAKSKALKLLITSLSTGWWNTYAITRAAEIMTVHPDIDQHFTNKIKELQNEQ